jgi:predicted 2-oxoglutarate/Fe(II)-dependent dioxygenase YbiX
MEEQEYIKKMNTISKNIPPDCIFILDNVIPENICKSIINEIDHTPTVKEKDIAPYTNVKCRVMSKCLEDLKHCEYISKILYDIGGMMPEKYGVIINGCTAPQFRKIYGNTRIHVDDITLHSVNAYEKEKENTSSKKRSLSAVFALNGDYEGGEFVFPVQNRKIKLKMGQVILFPPYWTHPHYTNDLKNNTFRYTMNTWFCEN